MSTGVSPGKNLHSAPALIDRAAALSRVDGDGELMSSLVDIFFTEAGPMMEAVRAAVTHSDSEKLEKAAHRLKGSISIFCAEAATLTAYEMEKMGRGGDLSKACEALARLEEQMTGLKPALKQFRTELQSTP